jgi:plastocyanin
MRIARLSIITILAVAVLVLGLAATAGATSLPRTYTVLVGAESVHRGITVTAFFPGTVTIHVGDTVHWIQNTNEIHTVTFLGGGAAPDLVIPGPQAPPDVPSPFILNPAAITQVAPPGGLGDLTTFVNSGLMGREPGQYRTFDLRFTAVNVYDYICLVHGQMMVGTVKVVPKNVWVPSPWQTRARGYYQIARQRAKAPAVVREAIGQIKPATKNPDGTWTHYVQIGYSKGQIDLMRFFPRHTLVRPGDTVVWQMSATNKDAPHTVTFLNGNPEPPLVTLAGTPTLPYISAGVFFSSQPAPKLTRTGLYSSGLMFPGVGPGTFTEVIGNITPGWLPYLCLLHDTSGMKGTLVVLPK